MKKCHEFAGKKSERLYLVYYFAEKKRQRNDQKHFKILLYT